LNNSFTVPLLVIFFLKLAIAVFPPLAMASLFCFYQLLLNYFCSVLLVSKGQVDEFIDQVFHRCCAHLFFLLFYFVCKVTKIFLKSKGLRKVQSSMFYVLGSKLNTLLVIPHFPSRNPGIT